MSDQKLFEGSKSLLLEQLLTFHTPFNWEFPDSFPTDIELLEDIIEIKTKLLKEEFDAESDFKWRSYTLKLVLSVLHYKVQDLGQALETINKCDELCFPPDYKNQAATGNDFFDSIKQALLHVLNATKARILFEQGDYESVQEMIPNIPSISEMNNKNQAGLCGIKVSTFGTFYREFSKLTLTDARQATHLDPEQPEWWFLLGKSLRRVRRLDTLFDEPSMEELVALEKADSMKPCVAYTVFPAMAFAEWGKRLRQKYAGQSNVKSEIMKLNEKSNELFKKALAYPSLTRETLLNIGKGLMNLPPPYNEPKKTKEILDRCVEMDKENQKSWHYLGMYYERTVRDFTTALKYHQLALEKGSFGAGMDIIHLNSILDPNYNPRPVFERLKERFKNNRVEMDEISLQEGCYYIIMERNLDKGLEMLIQILHEMSPHKGFQKFRPSCLMVPTPISLCELLYHELKSKEKLLLSSSEENVAEQILLRRQEALDKVLSLQPDLLDVEVDDQFVDTLKRNSQNYINNSKKNYHTGRRTDSGPYSDKSNYHNSRTSNEQYSRGYNNRYRTDNRQDQYRSSEDRGRSNQSSNWRLPPRRTDNWRRQDKNNVGHENRSTCSSRNEVNNFNRNRSNKNDNYRDRTSSNSRTRNINTNSNDRWNRYDSTSNTNHSRSGNCSTLFSSPTQDGSRSRRIQYDVGNEKSLRTCVSPNARIGDKCVSDDVDRLAESFEGAFGVCQSSSSPHAVDQVDSSSDSDDDNNEAEEYNKRMKAKHDQVQAKIKSLRRAF